MDELCLAPKARRIACASPRRSTTWPARRFARSNPATPARVTVCEAAASGVFSSNPPLEHAEVAVNLGGFQFLTAVQAGRRAGCEEYWMRSAVNLAVGVMCALMLSLTPAAANRVALVVGIDIYDNFSPDLKI